MMVWLLFKLTAWCVALNTAILVLAVALGGLFPGGDQLLYEARVNRNIDIFVLDINRCIVHNLTHHPAIDSRPAWSPDGRFIAFESTRGIVPQIYVTDGQRTRPLISGYRHSQYNPVWYGQAVIFQSYNSRGAPTFRVKLDGSGLEQITPLDPPTRAQGSRALVMAYKKGKWGIYMYSDNWRELRQLTDNNIRFRDAPRWSPDEQQLAFVSSASGHMDIYVMNADGSAFRRVTSDGLFKNNLTWRP